MKKMFRKSLNDVSFQALRSLDCEQNGGRRDCPLRDASRYSESRKRAFILVVLLYLAEIRNYSRVLKFLHLGWEDERPWKHVYCKYVFVVSNRLQDDYDIQNSHKSTDIMTASE